MRYLPHTLADRKAMLDVIGVSSVEDLFCDVPPEARLEGLVDLPRGMGELEVERVLGRLAGRNISARDWPFFIGGGAYFHHVPASVDHLIQRSEFLTAYTPYQPEIAQGTLQYLFEFQTQVAMITGMEVANASLYDGSTACGEAMLMAHRLTRRPKAVLSGGLHPHYRAVCETLSRFSGHTVVATACDSVAEDEAALVDLIDEQTACIVVQTPNVFGSLTDLSRLAEAAHEKGALLVAVVPEVVSLGLVKPPGEMGADIVVGEGQSVGNSLQFGGPYLGLFSTRERFVRQMPGRLCGQTVDEDGKRGFVLTLTAREQHIRRERATSNICTNSGLCCLAFTIHMALLGETGFRRLAAINHARAVHLADCLAAVPGVEVMTERFFNEFTIRVPGDGAQIIEALVQRRILGGIPGERLFPGVAGCKDRIVVAATEMNTDEDCEVYADALRAVLQTNQRKGVRP